MNISGEAATAYNAVRLDSLATINRGVLVSGDEDTGVVSWKDSTGTTQTITLGPHIVKLVTK